MPQPKHILVATLIALLAGPALAATITVKDGSIADAVASAKAGDTIVVAPGSYNEVITVTTSGTEKAPIAIKSAKPRKAKVKGFRVQADYITIDGFEIANDAGGANGVDCGQTHMKTARKGCKILNNYIHDVKGAAINAGEKALVTGNLMKNVGRGVFVNSDSLVENNEIDTLMVQWIEKNGKKRVKKTQYAFFSGDHITFRGNYWHSPDLKPMIQGQGVDFFVSWDAWIFPPSSHILIENNRCFRATHACEAEATQHKKSSHLTIRNNLFVDTVYVGVLPKHWTNITVENNTFINCGAYPIWFQSKLQTQGAVVKNNLIAYYKHDPEAYGGPAAESGIRNNAIDTDPTATVDCDYNMMFATNNRGYGEHDFVAEPQFVDPDNGDFRLKPGSPGIDAGMKLDSIKTDLRGVKRPQGKGYDIGAFEMADNEPAKWSPKSNK